MAAATAGGTGRRSALFEGVVGDPEPGEAPEIAAARPLAEEVLDAAAALSPLPIPRDDVLAMREDVQATAPNVIVTDVLPDPHPDVAAMIFGTFDAPVWVENGYVVRDDDGAPVPIGTAPIDFILALPAAAAESGGAPIVMYQHGNPGNAPDEVPGAARDFLAPAGFAVGGMTDVPNRTFAAVLEQTLAIFTYVLFFGEPPESVVDGFTLINGGGSPGPGIYMYYNSNPTISNCIITGNTSGQEGGGGIYCALANPTITNCTITGNSAIAGGGVYLQMSSPTIRNCVIAGNTVSTLGGGIYCDTGSTPTIVNLSLIHI